MSLAAPRRQPVLTPLRAPRLRLWTRWRERARQGPRVLVYHLLRRTRARLRLTRVLDLQAHEMVAVPLWRLRLPPRLARGLRVDELHPEQVAALERLRPPVGEPYPLRWAAAHRCIAAWLDDRVVAFVWLRRGPARLPSALGCVWLVPAAMAWIYDIYSDPQVLGAVPHLYAHLRQHPPGEGVQWLVGQTELDNQRSRLAHRSIGYQVRGTLWSARLGRLRFHLSRGVVSQRWRWHRGGDSIPLHLLAREFEQHSLAGAGEALKLQCSCGRSVSFGGDRFACACGRVLGSRQHGRAVLGAATPYWGEISQSAMRHLLWRAGQVGWREAAAEQLSGALFDYISSPERAAFHELLPLGAGARVLDLGAGWGGIAAPLARRFRVVALEGVPERARFLALRQRQERLDSLEVVQGDAHDAPLAPHQFDAVIANGVLEWAAVRELWGRPRQVQVQFLCRLREWLAPGGAIYLAIENRCGWAQLRGALDHSGLPYTSLLPRPLARRVCARRAYRTADNVGYRTYTYTYRGYRRLFADAGLRIAAAWVCSGGYNLPRKMVPLQGAAIRYAQADAPSPLQRAAARPWVWRWLGSDFAFLLTPVSLARPEPPSALGAESQHA